MIRPVFLARNFYGDDVKKGKRYHEIALYYLLDVSGTDLLSRVDTKASIPFRSFGLIPAV